MQRSARRCWQGGGYVYATRAEEIARAHGFDRLARLASNENPFPPSPLAVERAREALEGANRYPPESLGLLQQAFGAAYPGHRFVFGNGMDGIIETVVRVLVDPGDRVVIAAPTFSFYGLAAAAQSACVEFVPREEDFTLDVDAFIAAARGAKLAFLCTPNNPTGTSTPVKDVAKILDCIDGVLFLDNAYVEFSGLDYMPLARRFDNLIIGRTMSKAYSLAGLRFGYASVPEWFVQYYMRAATPFSVNVVTAAAAAGALADGDHVERSVEHVRCWRKRIAEECGRPTFPSAANFILIDVAPLTGNEAMERLAARGVLVRTCSSFPGLEDHYIRVSVGEAWENQQFLREMHQV
jgi:histidinol-phosphate aminotransferase